MANPSPTPAHDQITLPKAVRDALGLSKGTILKVELDGGRIILRKSVDDAISRARGRFKLDARPCWWTCWPTARRPMPPKPACASA
ncbi:AbrB/MazE/SpoVT family DNA-binding domain-containing protein [Xanthomonas sp. A2111]|uniref:AbrB/MazE/SpoVT family DNA-binding domain-containing protein n=1 Tax=Xanthomonas hawaiiensis TaxID=3003247 RepID=A0ABU2I1M8_9XANT|nr:AbrB/MazE/SpoVT family DNA-binding domain-containing protein [Xanthomonas sp. A2111]MDS9991312.1 AbrB/MazE/SpoVT family DNA-binding domain-containing protein [Xanthomonas sp. A2111]